MNKNLIELEAAMVADLYEIVARLQTSIECSGLHMIEQEKSEYTSLSLRLVEAEKRARTLGTKRALVLAEVLNRMGNQVQDGNDSISVLELKNAAKHIDPYDEGFVDIYAEAQGFLCVRWKEIGSFYIPRLEKFIEAIINGPPPELFLFEQTRNYDIWPYIRVQTRPVTYDAATTQFDLGRETYRKCLEELEEMSLIVRLPNKSVLPHPDYAISNRSGKEEPDQNQNSIERETM